MNTHRTYMNRLIALLTIVMMGVGSAMADTWDGTVPSTANVSVAECNKIGITGSGTKASPFVISKASQFAYFASKMNGNTGYWKLGADIDLNGSEHVWTYGQSNANFKGHFDGDGHTISNMAFVTNAANKCFGLFPQIQGSSATDHAYVKKLTLKDCNVTTPDASTSYGATTKVGIAFGQANGNVDIDSVTISDGSIAYTVTTTGTNYVGCLGGYVTSDNCTVKDCTVEGTSFTTGDAKKSVFYAGGLVGGASNNSSFKGNKVTVSITHDGATSGNNYIGGFIGYAKGSNSTVSATLPMGKRIVLQGNTVHKSVVKMNGDVATATLAMGGFFGYVDNHVNILNNKVDTTVVAVTNNINATSYVGGAIGFMNAYTFVDGMIVSGGSVSGPSSSKIIKNNVAFFVGGFLGYMNSSGSANAYQPDKFMNIAVTGIDINLGNYVPANDAPIANNKFSVGGIAGSVNAPNRDANGWCGMPENLIFKGGKIYAPLASTSPTVSNFNAGANAHNSMTTEPITTIDALDKCKVKTWYYTDYKLGLSAEFLASTAVKAYNATPAKDEFRKNYSVSPKKENGISYITVKNTTFLRQNRYQDSERDSWTVLWWTNQATLDNTKGTVSSPNVFTNEEQPIYPQSGASVANAGYLKDYPYYMYFYQGVSNATYTTAAVSDKIIEGIEGNFKQAQKDKPLVLSIANNKENVRGFDALTISVKAFIEDKDTTSSYTYQWYVDGKAKTTATSFSLRPHWKNGQGITVNALKDGVVVATATYTLAPGVMKTKAGATELIRSDIKNRGTKDNPYIIDHENALRQLSYLSTAQTGTLWEGIVKPGSPYPTNQVVGHYNRAYYELSKDITMSNTDFVPISHVGYGSDGTWGSYSNNFIFQGHFDGKLHAIKNLHITWGAGQYNGNDNKANIYYGLFGAVGHSAATAKWGDGSTTSNTVIKNLVIDGAVLTHDVSNTTFSYQKDYKHITAVTANNCMVGVLAGMVTSNTTIQNIEIRSSKITDEGSEEYSLATRGLYVGGAIGSVQSAYNITDAVPVSLTIDHVAANVNISLKNPVFQSSSAIDQICLFNVGGIIGRFITTKGTQTQVLNIMPKYTLFSGDVVAPKAWVSPVLASLRYSSNNTITKFDYYSQQWEGNSNVANSQLNITNAHYYNYSIEGTLVTDLYPENKCTWDARPVTSHADGMGSTETYTPKMYQGVNYGAIWVDAEGSSLKTLNENKADDIYWTWKDGFVHMTTTPCLDAYLTSVENTERTGVVLTATMSDESTGTYRWQESFDGVSWIDLDGEILQEYPTAYVSTPKFIVSYVKVGGKEYRTLPFMVRAENMTFSPYLKSEGFDDNGDGKDDRFAFEVMWKDDLVPNSSYEVTYQWCKTDGSTPLEGETSRTLELDKAELDDAGGSVWCVVKINYLGREIAKFSVRSYLDATVVFVSGSSGVDNAAGSTERGWSPEKPVKTINHANSLLKSADKGGTWDNNIIVIMGVLTPNNFAFQSNGTNPATLTGKWDGTDYKGVIKLDQINSSGSSTEHAVNSIQADKPGANCYILGDTKFENLTFYGNKKGNTFIELHGRNAIFGKGLVMTNFANLSTNHGNMGGNEKIPEFTILLYATNLSEDKISEYTQRIHKQGKPQTVTFQSGHYGRLMAGRFTQNFFYGYTDKATDSWKDNTAYSILGSAQYPVWAVINVDIDNDNEMTDGGSVTYTRDINAIISGLTDGSMYGDLQVNFHGGNVSYIVGANQGNAVRNGKMKYTPVGGVEGVYGQLPNASYFGRSVINVEQDPKLKNINVGHLYAGGLGREVQAGSATAPVDMYLYGRTEVNIKSGTISGNAYGGGTGGVIGVNPWDDHLPYATTAENDVTKAIMNGVQYGDKRYGDDSWSAMDKDTSPLVKVVLHNRKASGDGYDIDSLNLSQSSTTLNISGGTINGNVYGGGYGEVPDMPIESAMQGIGSVFGTSNINITGGVIDGSIYGGSRGSGKYYNVGKNIYGKYINHIAEMNGEVNLTISGTVEQYPTIGGNIYGAGQGIEATQRKATQADVDEGKAANVGDTYMEEYLRIATTGNKDLLGETHKTNVNILIDLPEIAPFNGNIYGGGEFGVVDGNTNITIRNGTFNGNIFGGGKGKNNEANRNKAKINGSTNVKIGEK